MKKLVLMIVLIFTTFLLVACGDPYDINFRESEIVEMSNEDVATLLSEVDWEVYGEAMSITIDANVDFTLDKAYSSSFYSYTQMIDASLKLNSTTFIVDSETIAEVAVHSFSEIDVSVDQSMAIGDGEPETSSQTVNGTIGVYFTQSYLYVNPEISSVEDGSETAISGKEKLNEEVTQDMWDEFRAMETTDTGGMVSIAEDLPAEIMNLLTLENVEALLDAFPAVTVYQRGTITNVHFEVDKALVSNHLEDLLWFAYDTGVAAGEDMPSLTEAEADIQDALDEVDTYLDYFDEIGLSLDITIDEGKLARIALEVFVVSNEGFTDETDATIDANISFVISYSANFPSFPNDLDEYTPVDEIGQNYGIGNILSMSLSS